MNLNDRRNQLLIIFLVSFLLRVVISVKIDQVISGSYGYYDYAKNLLDGRGYYWDYTNNQETLIVRLVTFRPPVYTLMYTLLLFVFGNHSLPFILVQSALGALVPLIAFGIAKEIWNERTGIWAAVLTAVYPHFVTRPANVSEDNLYIPFIYLAILFSLYFVKDQRRSSLIAGALFVSLALLTRQTIILFIPLLLVFLMYHAVPKERFKIMLLFSLTVFVCVMPWILFHYKHYQTVSISDSSGRTLWTGNNSITYDHAEFPVHSIDGIERALWKSIPQDSVAVIRGLNTYEQDQYFMRSAIKFIKENPIDFVVSFYYKNLGLFSIFYNPISNGEWSGWRNRIHTIFYTPVLLLGMTGMILSRKQWKKSFILLMLILSFVIISWVFWSHTRHAISYHLVWIIFGGFAMDCILSKSSLKVFQ